jgi:hypothetical protein
MSRGIDARSHLADAARPGEALATTRRRWMAGGLLALGGLTLAAAQIVQPRGGDDVFAVSLAESRGRWIGWGLLVMATSLLQLPAVASLRSSVATGRGARLTSIGGGMAFVSLVALFAFAQSHAEAATLVGPSPVPEDLLQAFSRLDSAISLGITTILGLFGFHIGWPLLLAGLARAGHLPPPLAIIGAAAIFLSFFGAALGPWGETALFVLAALCIATVGMIMAYGTRTPRPKLPLTANSQTS